MIDGRIANGKPDTDMMSRSEATRSRDIMDFDVSWPITAATQLVVKHSRNLFT